MVAVNLVGKTGWMGAMERFADGEMSREETLAWFREGIMGGAASEGLTKIVGVLEDVSMVTEDCRRMERTVYGISAGIQATDQMSRTMLDRMKKGL